MPLVIYGLEGGRMHCENCPLNLIVVLIFAMCKVHNFCCHVRLACRFELSKAEIFTLYQPANITFPHIANYQNYL